MIWVERSVLADLERVVVVRFVRFGGGIWCGFGDEVLEFLLLLSSLEEAELLPFSSTAVPEDDGALGG